MDYATVKIDTETTCGHPIEGWHVSFRLHWSYDYDSGHEVEARFYRAQLGNQEINRAMAIAIFGEQGVRTMENDATTHVAERMAELVKAAE